MISVACCAIAEIANSAKFNFETRMNKGFPGLAGKGIERL
jgi:hypothetical protein